VSLEETLETAHELAVEVRKRFPSSAKTKRDKEKEVEQLIRENFAWLADFLVVNYKLSLPEIRKKFREELQSI